MLMIGRVAKKTARPGNCLLRDGPPSEIFSGYRGTTRVFFSGLRRTLNATYLHQVAAGITPDKHVRA